MKAKKFLMVLTGALTMAVSAFAASLRDYVCIVRPVLAEDSVKFLEGFRDELKSEGYSKWAGYIDSYIKDGTFGSGFIVFGSDRKPYIITNRHVVREAVSVTAQFENSDGSIQEYKDLEILYSDEDVDLAVIALPSGFNRKGLTFVDANVDDGDDVWSAGFPGLDGKPMWQLGKGTVTNATARLDELLDSKVSTLIQHSAQIDGGNSGGPLLVKSSKAEAGYAVAGVNAWKATYRDSTNFSIPASLVKKIFDKSLTKNKGALTIDKRITQFLEAGADAESDYEDFLKFVSNKMVSQFGFKTFEATWSMASSKERETLGNIFAYDPIEGIRCAIAYQIRQSLLKKGKPVKVTASDIVEGENSRSVTFTPEGGKEITSSWIQEQGNWKLLEYSAVADSLKAQAVRVANPYIFKFDAGFSFPMSAKSTAGWRVGGYYTSGLLSYGINVFSGTSFYKKYSSDDTETPVKLTCFGPTLGLQVPLMIQGKVLVVPKLEGTVGMAMPFFDGGGVFFGVGGGVEVGWMFGQIAPFVGFDVRYINYRTNSSSSLSGVINAGIRVLHW